MSYPTARLDVDLNALLHNFRVLQSRAPNAEIAPVVKADAYGLGATRVGPYLARNGARTFFVARVDEGIQLRHAIGPGPIIYVLDGITGSPAEELVVYDLRPVLNTVERCFDWVNESHGSPAALHVDTGMNRLGVRVDQLSQIPGRFIAQMTLIMSHLACSDEPSHPMNLQQLQRFRDVRAAFPDIPASLGNSGGVFLGEDYTFDLCRPGISLYGGGPEGVSHPALKPVATLLARVLQVRDMPAGESVGYGAGFFADSPRRLATIGIGYADGLPRAFATNGRIIVNGTLCRLAGRISMDVCSVDVTGLELYMGDTVELFGKSQSLDDVAAQAGTISYEILTRLGPRIARHYI